MEEEEEAFPPRHDDAPRRALLHLDAFREKCAAWGFPWQEPQRMEVWQGEAEDRLPDEIWLLFPSWGALRKSLRVTVTGGVLQDLRCFGKGGDIPDGFYYSGLALATFYPAFYWYFHE